MSRPRPKTRRPPARTADVWTADLGAPRDLSILTGEERDRAARIRGARERERWVAARVFLRETLSRYVAEVVIEVAEGGKPFLVGRGVSFSLSHSGDVAMLAVSGDEVGVDVEQVRADRDLIAIARRAFTADVADAVATDEDPVARFYAEWTLHEARAKLAGGGLFGPVDPHVVAVAVDAPPGCFAAIASAGPLDWTHCQA